MDLTWLLMTLPQFLLIALALFWAARCYILYPEKRWRFLALVVWLAIALIGKAIAGTVLVLPTEQLDTFRWIHWIDTTVATIGYIAVAVTCWLICDHYKRLGYGK